MSGRHGSSRSEVEQETQTGSDTVPVHSFVNELRPGGAKGFRISTPAFDFDASALPLVVTTIHALDSVDDVLALERAFVRVYERGERLFFITELRSVSRIDGHVRHASAEMARRLEPFDVELSLGAAVVVASPVLRATIVALKWIAKPTVPESYVGTREEAVAIAERRLGEAGIEIGAAVSEKLAEFVDARG